MKALALAVALLAFASPLRAQNVRCDLLIVRVSLADAMRLRPILLEPGRVAAGVSELHTMIADGKAELIAAPVLWTKSNQRAVTETLEEIRYQTEFDPPSAPTLFGARTPPTWEQIVQRRLFHFITVPTAFEVRNAGVTLELSPVVADDGRTISLDLVPRHVSYEGDAPVSTTALSRAEWRWQQPKFRTFVTTTSLTVRSGEWHLHNGSVLRAPARMEFFLLRATAVPYPK